LRCVAHGSVWFSPPDAERVLELMRLQCSAVRSACQAYQKHGLRGNKVRRYVKRRYMEPLNQGYINDACSMVQVVRYPNFVFGGRSAWDDLQAGRISREDWQARRNSQLYSRGDRGRGGNPHIQLRGSVLRVRDPRGRWIEGRAYVPTKFQPDPTCYAVRLLRRDGSFVFRIEWDASKPPVRINHGALGVTIGPLGVAVLEVGPDGNVVGHHVGAAVRWGAGPGKRLSDVRAGAADILREAEKRGRKLVVETRGRIAGPHRDQTRHREAVEALLSRAMRRGVEAMEVDTAFMVELGSLKYRRMYSLSDQGAAAMIIARRGLWFKERMDFKATCGMEKGILNLEGRGVSIALSRKRWPGLKRVLRPQAALAGLCPAAVANPAERHDAGGIPAGEQPITGRLCPPPWGVEAEEGLPSGLHAPQTRVDETPLQIGGISFETVDHLIRGVAAHYAYIESYDDLYQDGWQLTLQWMGQPKWQGTTNKVGFLHAMLGYRFLDKLRARYRERDRRAPGGVSEDYAAPSAVPVDPAVLLGELEGMLNEAEALLLQCLLGEQGGLGVGNKVATLVDATGLERPVVVAAYGSLERKARGLLADEGTWQDLWNDVF